MKIHSYFRFFVPALVMLAAGVFNAGCAGSPKTSAGNALFFTTTYGETVPASDDSDNTLELSFTLVDSRDERLKEFVRSLLYSGRSPEDYAAKITDDLKTTYILTLEENSDWGLDQSWSYNEGQEVLVKGPYALVTQAVDVYQGGAHPNYNTFHYVLDTQAPGQLGLKDIITEDGMQNLPGLMDRELRLFSGEAGKIPLPPGQPLSSGIYFDDSVDPADFFPAADGLHFTWNPYEIAAYVYGIIEITVGWDELSLTGEGEKLAAAFKN
ncbi:MAG: RsiV family protein [Treponema sp.]|jgi:hypothetical protein|nr:RsiV family protein [Treponema sp.]